jgi:hypothetical protein
MKTSVSTVNRRVIGPMNASPKKDVVAEIEKGLKIEKDIEVAVPEVHPVAEVVQVVLEVVPVDLEVVLVVLEAKMKRRKIKEKIREKRLNKIREKIREKRLNKRGR